MIASGYQGQWTVQQRLQVDRFTSPDDIITAYGHSRESLADLVEYLHVDGSRDGKKITNPYHYLKNHVRQETDKGQRPHQPADDKI